MAQSIFSRIIQGEIPCHRVYQDEHVLAFLDIHPVSYGHTLVVTKEPAPTMHELSSRAAAGLGAALPKICRAVLGATGAEAYNLVQNNGSLAGQEVNHVHVHIIPRYADRPVGLGVRWEPIEMDGKELEELGRRIARLC